MSQTSYRTRIEPVVDGRHNDPKYQSYSEDESFSEFINELDFDDCAHLMNLTSR